MRPLVTLRLTIRVHTSRGYRVHTLLCRGSGLPLHFLVWPANAHDAPFARPLLELALRLYQLRPRSIRLDAGYWGLQLIRLSPHHGWRAVAVVPWNRHSPEEPLLPAAHLEAREELGKRSSIERFFGRVFLFFRRPRPPYSGWSAIVSQVALLLYGHHRCGLGRLASQPS